ncbi:hypothetical protein NE237_026369 [Protea cynaroides]|uniref:Uncharacterized protein n=1 Tax=Protea cynaroides TaxID=273540 RepID=A0A9Q0H6K4_9MAGN|nr:hypothetical protein NE237_026369 [Protea cynaroides]
MFNLGRKTLLAGLSIIQSTTNQMKVCYFSPTQMRLKTTIPSNRKRFRRTQKVSSVVRSEGEIHRLVIYLACVESGVAKVVTIIYFSSYACVESGVAKVVTIIYFSSYTCGNAVWLMMDFGTVIP